MFSMDVKEYKDLIATGKTDREIIASHKTTAGNFYSWKRANGLVEQRIKRETAAKSEQLVASDLLREKREGKVITPSTATEDMITSLKKQLKQLNSDHLMAVAQHEKDMNELYGRLKQANAANAQLAFDAVNAQDELEKLRAEIGVLPGGKSSIKVLEEENALLRSEALSLRKQVQELSQLAAADTVDCDDNLVTELYAKIDLLNGQLTRQATNNNTANLITMIEEEEVFQTHLLRKLLAEREQRLALSAENKILTERVGLV